MRAESSPGGEPRADGSPAELPRSLLRSCLLLLLAEGPAHGYELLDALPALGLARVDPGGLYRCLRALDQERLVLSAWEPSAQGPARRTYQLTADGVAWLHRSAASVRAMHHLLGGYLDRYAACFPAETLR